MDEATRELLGRLNRVFYEGSAEEFDRTRQRPWPGWQALEQLLAAESGPLSVLDVGCGNGRFGRFLIDRLRRPVRYLGIDSSQALLRRASEQLPAEVRLLRRDLLDGALATSLPEREFDLIAVFGVLHHLPAFDTRLRILEELLGLLHAGGWLALSFWQWQDHPRLQRRIVPWQEGLPDELGGLGPRDLQIEPGDHLLRWGRDEQRVRYCHHFDDDEIEELLASLPVDRIADYRQDGDLNRYLVLNPRPESRLT